MYFSGKSLPTKPLASSNPPMQSMTGFGRGTSATGDWIANVELSSVNRKQAEVVLQAARGLGELEARIRKSVLEVISRGRVQVSISVESTGGSATSFHVDRALAVAFAKAFAELGEATGYQVVPTASDFIRQADIITTDVSQIDAESAWLAISPALEEALRQILAMRSREGEDLKADFLNRLGNLEKFVRKIEGEGPGRMVRQRELLMKRLADAELDLDPGDERVAKEIALFADRCDVSEEVTRLGSHFTKFREYLEAAEPPGRALDFLCQEMFREFNTIGSKANDASIAQTIVEAKTELEKIREQVQNVE